MLLSRLFSVYIICIFAFMCELDRFILFQDQCMDNVIDELNNNRKRTHWIWFIFPQCTGLGLALMSIKYSIKSSEEPIDYLNNQTLYERLMTCCNILLKSDLHNIKSILGYPDDLKFKSFLTLFMNVDPLNLIFKFLDKYFNGQECSHTRIFNLYYYTDFFLLYFHKLSLSFISKDIQ